MDRDEMNEAAWSIVDQASGKGRRVRKKKLPGGEREFRNFNRRMAAAKERQLIGSGVRRGRAGASIRTPARPLAS
jgi:hypothetical protein